MVDRLSDMVARIKNSQRRGRLEVVVLGNKLCIAVLDCLYEEGYIRGYVFEDKTIRVFLKYKYGKSVIRKIQRISKPSFRKYYSAQELRNLYLKNHKIIFTSSAGVFLNSSLVFQDINVGGEALIVIN